MAKRMIIMLIAVTTFVAAIGFVKFRQVQAAIAQATAWQPPPEAVTTTVARLETWRPTLGAIGSVAAVNGVTVSADLPGVVEKIAFESGDTVRAGALLVQLDTRQERAQLAAAQARLDLARLNHDRIEGLLKKGVVSTAEHDAAAAALQEAEANVGEIRATIERKTIRAPFTGLLGIRQINVGQYLTSGSPVVPLQSLDPVYVNFAVPQQDFGSLRVGGEVKVEAEGLPGASFTGSISAVDAVVDASTRNVQVQATLANPDGTLRPGMFVTSQVVLRTGDPVVSLPASSISYAPYGNSVFIVEDVKAKDGSTYRGLRQQFVKLGDARGDQVAIRSGVEAGAEVVTSGVFKLRNGAAVQVNNETRPGNDPAPAPEDN